MDDLKPWLKAKQKEVDAALGGHVERADEVEAQADRQNWPASKAIRHGTKYQLAYADREQKHRDRLGQGADLCAEFIRHGDKHRQGAVDGEGTKRGQQTGVDDETAVAEFRA